MGTIELDTIPASELVMSATGRWWILRCSSKWEGRMLFDLHERGGIPVVLHQKRTKARKDQFRLRTDVWESRMFPYTSFVNLPPTPDAYPRDFMSRATNALAPLSIEAISPRSQGHFHNELVSLSRSAEIVDLGANQTLKAIPDGSLVEITNGPLRGIQGWVTDSKPGILTLTLTMMASMHEIPLDDVEVIQLPN